MISQLPTANDVTASDAFPKHSKSLSSEPWIKICDGISGKCMQLHSLPLGLQNRSSDSQNSPDLRTLVAEFFGFKHFRGPDGLGFRALRVYLRLLWAWGLRKSRTLGSLEGELMHIYIYIYIYIYICIDIDYIYIDIN